MADTDPRNAIKNSTGLIARLIQWLDTNKVNTNDERLSDNRTPSDSSVTFAKLANEFKNTVALSGSEINWTAGDLFTKTLSANTTLTTTNLTKGIRALIISGNYELTLPSWLPNNQIVGEYIPGSDKHLIEIRCTNAESGSEDGWCFINKAS